MAQVYWINGQRKKFDKEPTKEELDLEVSVANEQADRERNVEQAPPSTGGEFFEPFTKSIFETFPLLKNLPVKDWVEQARDFVQRITEQQQAKSDEELTSDFLRQMALNDPTSYERIQGIKPEIAGPKMRSQYGQLRTAGDIGIQTAYDTTSPLGAAMTFGPMRAGQLVTKAAGLTGKAMGPGIATADAIDMINKAAKAQNRAGTYMRGAQGASGVTAGEGLYNVYQGFGEDPNQMIMGGLQTLAGVAGLGMFRKPPTIDPNDYFRDIPNPASETGELMRIRNPDMISRYIPDANLTTRFPGRPMHDPAASLAGIPERQVPPPVPPVQPNIPPPNVPYGGTPGVNVPSAPANPISMNVPPPSGRFGGTPGIDISIPPPNIPPPTPYGGVPGIDVPPPTRPTPPPLSSPPFGGTPGIDVNVPPPTTPPIITGPQTPTDNIVSEIKKITEKKKRAIPLKTSTTPTKTPQDRLAELNGKKQLTPEETAEKIQLVTENPTLSAEYQQFKASIDKAKDADTLARHLTTLEAALGNPKYQSPDKQAIFKALIEYTRGKMSPPTGGGAGPTGGGTGSKPLTAAETARKAEIEKQTTMRGLQATLDLKKHGLPTNFASVEEAENAIRAAGHKPTYDMGILERLLKEEAGAFFTPKLRPLPSTPKPTTPGTAMGPGSTGTTSQIDPDAGFWKNFWNASWDEKYNLARGTQGVDPIFGSSALMRQLAPYFGTQIWRQAAAKQLKVWMDSGVYGADKAAREMNPLFAPKATFRGERGTIPTGFGSVAEDMGGLKLADVTDITRREEQIKGALAEKIGFGIGKYIKKSNEAYTIAINHVRASAFEDLVTRTRAWDPVNKKVLDPEKFRAAGELVNTLTGRGDYKFKLGQKGLKLPEEMGGTELYKQISIEDKEQVIRVLGRIFYSPRLIARNIQMLNPMTYTNLPPELRKEALTGLFRQIGTWWGIAQLAELTGIGTVSKDPNSSDFGKIRIGNTRIDPGGGLQQYLVLWHRIAGPLGNASWTGMAPQPTNTGFTPLDMVTNYLGTPGGQVTIPSSGQRYTYGEGFRSPTRLSDMQQFLSYKLHPIAKQVYDFAAASENRPFYVGDRLASMFMPMFIGDLAEAIAEDPGLVPFAIPMSGLGMGSQTFEGGPSQPVYGEALNRLTGMNIPDYRFESGLAGDITR